MLVFKCACGKACSASSTGAGAYISCGSCGEQVLVPSASDPNCVLIFRRGDPEAGRPLTADEFQHLLNEGALYDYDLIWHHDSWLPLGKVYELPPPPPVPMDGSLAEIALNFQDLPAVGGYPRVPRRKKRVVKFDSIKVTGTEGDKAQKSPKDIKKILATTVKGIFVAAILIFGAIRMGRIINFALKRVSHVCVVNTFNCNVRMKLSGYGWVDMPEKIQVTQPDVYVAFPCRKKMIFVEGGAEFGAVQPRTDADKMPSRPLVPSMMRVPVRPGYDTVVNPGGRASFGIYDLSGLSALSLNSPELKNLSLEISDNKAPVSVLKVMVQIQDLVKDCYKGKSSDLFFSSKDYSFEYMNITRSADFSNISRDKDAAAEDEERLFSLVYPSERTLGFRNGSVLYNHDNNETERSIILTSKEFIPKKDYALTSSVPRLQIRYDRQWLVLQLPGLNGDIKGPQKAIYKANWIYEARMSKAGQWTWRWVARYQKPTSPGKPGENWQLIIDQNGVETNEKVK